MGDRLTSLLLHAGADATAEDKEGVQPIHWAFASASDFPLDERSPAQETYTVNGSC